MELQTMTMSELEAMTLDGLRDVARSMDITGYTRLKKYDLIMRLLRANAEQQCYIFVGGILEGLFVEATVVKKEAVKGAHPAISYKYIARQHIVSGLRMW